MNSDQAKLASAGSYGGVWSPTKWATMKPTQASVAVAIRAMPAAVRIFEVLGRMAIPPGVRRDPAGPRSTFRDPVDLSCLNPPGVRGDARDPPAWDAPAEDTSGVVIHTFQSDCTACCAAP